MNLQILKQEENIKELMDQNKQKEEELQKQKQNEFMIPQVKTQGNEVQEIKVIEQSTDFLSNVKTDKKMEEINIALAIQQKILKMEQFCCKCQITYRKNSCIVQIIIRNGIRKYKGRYLKK
ncbi:unnamed protein product [Paramecium sonneborni]|uniref:Uncharacterized protein n=1 Tax=Paramecium sonneborni TaxID=65129 RepID=A0A8S1MSX2_9CILI|nr:unnamed protein product [Paramecium sonneborni]